MNGRFHEEATLCSQVRTLCVCIVYLYSVYVFVRACWCMCVCVCAYAWAHAMSKIWGYHCTNVVIKMGCYDL